MRGKEKIIWSGSATRCVHACCLFSVRDQGGLLWWGKCFPYEHPGEKQSRKWEWQVQRPMAGSRLGASEEEQGWMVEEERGGKGSGGTQSPHHKGPQGPRRTRNFSEMRDYWRVSSRARNMI